MANSSYNLTFDVPEQEYVLLDPGEYEFTVDSIEFDHFNGSEYTPPCQMAIVHFHIDTEKGRAFLDKRFYLCKERAGIIASFLKSIGKLNAGEKKFTLDWDAYPGCKGFVKTKQREYNGNMYNDIASFKPRTTSEKKKSKGYDLGW